MGPEPDPVASAAEGTVRALLKFAWDKLEGVGQRVSNRDLAFLGDPETIRRVKQKRAAAEYETLHKYVGDKKLWPVVASGLLLREIEDDPGEADRRERIRDAIYHSDAGRAGLRIAEIVQRGILTELIATKEEEGVTPSQLSKEIELMLNDLMSHIEFVEARSPVKQAFQKICFKVSTRSPQIVMGRGEAQGVLQQLADAMDGSHSIRYVLRRDDRQTYILVMQKDQWEDVMGEGRPSHRSETRRRRKR